MQSLAASRLPESGRARVVTKRVWYGEPYIRERTIAPHWLTENAERESARRFFVTPTTSRLSAFPSAAVRLSGSRRNTGCRSKMPLFDTVPVPNGPKLSDSLVNTPLQVNRTFRYGVPFGTDLEPPETVERPSRNRVRSLFGACHDRRLFWDFQSVFGGLTPPRVRRYASPSSRNKSPFLASVLSNRRAERLRTTV